MFSLYPVCINFVCSLYPGCIQLRPCLCPACIQFVSSSPQACKQFVSSLNTGCARLYFWLWNARRARHHAGQARHGCCHCWWDRYGGCPMWVVRSLRMVNTYQATRCLPDIVARSGGWGRCPSRRMAWAFHGDVSWHGVRRRVLRGGYT